MLTTIIRRISLLLGVLAAATSAPISANAANLQTGNTPIEVVVPAAIPAILQNVSPNAGDASLVLRITTLITNAWFDALAPYHSTAVGVYSDLGRRPVEEGLDNTYKNIAIMYASYHILNSVLSANAADWRAMMESVGLDPDDVSSDFRAPESEAAAIAVGNVAGWSIVAARERDGMNQLGDEGGVTYNLRPFADYTGYAPVNTAYQLRDPSRWQPAIVTGGNGPYQVQQFVTPQWRLTEPYSYVGPDQFGTPPPLDSDPRGPGGMAAYRAQADEVLTISAALTDEQKAKAEFFDNKLLAGERLTPIDPGPPTMGPGKGKDKAGGPSKGKGWAEATADV